MGYWTDVTKTGEEIVWGDPPADAVDALIDFVSHRTDAVFSPASRDNLVQAVAETVTPIFQRDLGRKPTMSEVLYGISFAGEPELLPLASIEPELVSA